MRRLIITSAILMVFSFGTSIFFNKRLVNEHKILPQKRITKVITVTIKIADHLPIKPQLNILDQYFINLFTSQISIIALLNDLPISNYYFNFLALNLTQFISDDYTLVLEPKSKALQYYSRYTVPLAPLINLGLNNETAKKILVLFKNHNLMTSALTEALNKLLPSVTRKYVALMHKFIIF